MKRVMVLAAAVLAFSGPGGPLSPPEVHLFAHPSAAQESELQQVVFTIENMTCALCKVTVKKVIEQVEGVQSVQIDSEAKTATVRFDLSITNAEAIAQASTNAGYPASPAS